MCDSDDGVVLHAGRLSLNMCFRTCFLCGGVSVVAHACMVYLVYFYMIVIHVFIYGTCKTHCWDCGIVLVRVTLTMLVGIEVPRHLVSSLQLGTSPRRLPLCPARQKKGATTNRKETREVMDYLRKRREDNSGQSK